MTSLRSLGTSLPLLVLACTSTAPSSESDAGQTTGDAAVSPPDAAIDVGAADAGCSTCATTYTFTTLAGANSAATRSIDATGAAAQFYSPRGVAVDGAGNTYVADSSNHTIRKITPLGVVTTLAGLAGAQGHADGSGSVARFIDPYGVALDNGGTLYVADTSGNCIRKITSGGVVTTLAGSLKEGSADGTGTAAQFHEPRGLVLDSANNVYVADYRNETVRKITPEGVVTTLAGTAGAEGNTDGTGAAARFRGLYGLAIDSSGTLYVSDSGNRAIRKVTSNGVVTTLASKGFADGAELRGITVDANGVVYVADFRGHTVYKVTSTGAVTAFAGKAGSAGAVDGAASLARFYSPSGLAVDATGNLLIADTLNNTIRKSTNAVITTIAGSPFRSTSVDGAGSAARFEDPYAVDVDSQGNAYVADATDHTIRKITAAGVVTTFAGSAGKYGSTDGTGGAARFFTPMGVAVQSDGTVYVADAGNHAIRKITAEGLVTTLAGTAGLRGANDGTGAAARFSMPNGVAVDSTGNVYVADTENGSIRKITPTGVTTTLAGAPGKNGFANGSGSDASFRVPFDVAADAAGNVYVSDHGNHAVRKITPSGVVSTLAGSGNPGSDDGTGSAASFRFPSGIGVTADGRVFVADTDNQVVRMISSAGVVTTIGGTARLTGSTNGVGSTARFFNPKDIAVDSNANVYVIDRGNYLLRKGTH